MVLSPCARDGEIELLSVPEIGSPGPDHCELELDPRIGAGLLGIGDHGAAQQGQLDHAVAVVDLDLRFERVQTNRQPDAERAWSARPGSRQEDRPGLRRGDRRRRDQHYEQLLHIVDRAQRFVEALVAFRCQRALLLGTDEDRDLVDSACTESALEGMLRPAGVGDHGVDPARLRLWPGRLGFTSRLRRGRPRVVCRAGAERPEPSSGSPLSTSSGNSSAKT